MLVLLGKIIISIVNHNPTHHHPQSLHTPPNPPLTSPPPTPAPTIKTTTNFTTHPHSITHLIHHHHPSHHHPLHNPTPPTPPPSHPIPPSPTPPPPPYKHPSTHPKNPPATHPQRKSRALMPDGPCSSTYVLPTCSSWALITFGILTCHVQIFSNPGRFQNLPTHHPHHHPHHNPQRGYNLAYDRTPNYTGGIFSRVGIFLTVTPAAPLDPPIVSMSRQSVGIARTELAHRQTQTVHIV